MGIIDKYWTDVELYSVTFETASKEQINRVFAMPPEKNEEEICREIVTKMPKINTVSSVESIGHGFYPKKVIEN